LAREIDQVHDYEDRKVAWKTFFIAQFRRLAAACMCAEWPMRGAAFLSI
jgi:hypothetical protein